MSVFLYALRAPESRRQYPTPLKKFLDFLKLEGNLEEQARYFFEHCHPSVSWAAIAETLVGGRLSTLIISIALFF
jgi:predicted DNA-binding protein with PD1-like motif